MSRAHDAQDLRKSLDSPAVRSLQKEKREKRANPETEEEALKRALKDSFPASDPISAVSNTVSGAPKKKK